MHHSESEQLASCIACGAEIGPQDRTYSLNSLTNNLRTRALSRRVIRGLQRQALPAALRRGRAPALRQLKATRAAGATEAGRNKWRLREGRAERHPPQTRSRATALPVAHRRTKRLPFATALRWWERCVLPRGGLSRPAIRASTSGRASWRWPRTTASCTGPVTAK